MKITVLAGGLSPERDVSLSSASKIARALIEKGHEVCIIDLYFGIKNIDDLVFTSVLSDIKEFSVSEKAPEFNREKLGGADIGPNVIEACKKGDIVFLALHGDVGENGKIQALLSLNGIRYTGSDQDGCLLSMDKNLSKLLAAAHGVRTAKWCVNVKDPSVNFPCVVKPIGGGSSIGVSVVNDFSELNTALNLAKKYDNDVLIEEKLDGREFSVGILSGRALPVIEIKPLSGFYDYKNKYQAGFTQEICPANIPVYVANQMQELALKLHGILHLKFYSRIDFIMNGKNEIYFLEANSLPGMTPTSLLPQEAAASGISYGELCDMIAQNALLKEKSTAPPPKDNVSLV
ncbi:MAG: D-alanine--D-alanine ligase [Eubacterium sp.]|nr:D-alanine--D-alanine ligase [Eubacterium sp.]